MTKQRSIASLLAAIAALLVTNLIVQGSKPAEAGSAAGIDPCPPDLDGDGVVAVPDLLQVLAAWGPCPSGARVMSMSKGDVGTASLMLIRLWSNNRLQVYMTTAGHFCHSCDESFPQPLTWTDIESPPLPAGAVPVEVVLFNNGPIYVAYSDGTVYLATLSITTFTNSGTNCSFGTEYCVMEFGEWELVP